jgi:hypothetical protein
MAGKQWLELHFDVNLKHNNLQQTAFLGCVLLTNSFLREGKSAIKVGSVESVMTCLGS